MSTGFTMNKQESEKKVFLAARDQGISSVLFRNATSRKLGLNATDAECLSFLMMNQVATPTELANYTGLTSGSTTTMLDRLERAGFIIRKPNPKDRRGVLVEALPHYMELAGPLVTGVQQAHRKLLAKYTEKELEVIADFLTGFTSNVTEQTRIIENLQ